MNREFMQLLEGHEEGLRAFFHEHQAMQAALRARVREVQSKLADLSSDSVAIYPWRDPALPLDILALSIASDEVKAQVDAIIDRSGWSIVIKARNGDLHPPIRRLCAWLGEGWKAEPPEQSGGYKVWPMEDGKGGSDQEVMEALQALLDRLAGSDGRSPPTG